MSGVYALRRANGDWFAFDDQGRLRVPVFRSSRDAMLARMSNTGMMLFKPVALDARAVGELAAGEAQGSTYFWLVDTPSVNVKRGHSLEHAQLSSLVNDTVIKEMPLESVA
jgi:hypothetical protein